MIYWIFHLKSVGRPLNPNFVFNSIKWYENTYYYENTSNHIRMRRYHKTSSPTLDDVRFSQLSKMVVFHKNWKHILVSGVPYGPSVQQKEAVDEHKCVLPVCILCTLSLFFSFPVSSLWFQKSSTATTCIREKQHSQRNRNREISGHIPWIGGNLFSVGSSNIRCDYRQDPCVSLCDRHNLKSSIIYDLPSGKGKLTKLMPASRLVGWIGFV